MVAGRIEIDDVAPVVSGGRFPAKAVVGEIVPVRATVWREGHDAVSATLVVRYHGTAYPQLADDPPGRVRPARARADRGRGQPAGTGQTAAAADVAGPNARRVPRPVQSRAASGCGPSGSTAGATRSRPGASTSPPSSTRARARAELSNDLLVGARLLERAATGVPRQHRYPADRRRGAAARARRPVHPRGRRAVRRGRPSCSSSIRCANWSPAASNTASGWTGRWPASARGTRCFRGPPAAGTPRATRCTAPSPPPPRRCRASPRWASTWSTCRRSTRSARCTARAATTA